VKQGEYQVTTGVRAIATPGHSAGHMSFLIELPKGAPVILCGDAADLTESLIDEIAPRLLLARQRSIGDPEYSSIECFGIVRKSGTVAES
jgi:hypothetical protein